jgi:hypothetical protein
MGAEIEYEGGWLRGGRLGLGQHVRAGGAQYFELKWGPDRSSEQDGGRARRPSAESHGNRHADDTASRAHRIPRA